MKERQQLIPRSTGWRPTDVRARLQGLHTATKRLATGRVAIYVYAGRKGELLCKAEGATLEEARDQAERMMGRPDLRQKAEEALRPQSRPEQSRHHVFGAVTAFLASKEYTNLGASSQKEYRYYLEAFREEFGRYALSMFESPRGVTALSDWRDEWADRPRSADYAMASVSRLFRWARGKGLTSAKPTEDIERLHSADRSDIIWLPEQIDAFCAGAAPELQWTIKLAAHTGLRQGDLIALPWFEVSDVAIVTVTSKRKRQVVIPIRAPLRELLAEIPRRADTVLTNSYGQSWTSDGLRASFRKRQEKAGLTGLRFHDLRGTAATNLRKAGSPDRDIAAILGWSDKQVQALLVKYVSAEAVALDMLERMKHEREVTNRRQTGKRSGRKT